MSESALTMLANHAAGLRWASQSGTPLILEPAACATLAAELAQIRTDAAVLLEAVHQVCSTPRPRTALRRSLSPAAVHLDRSVQGADLSRLRDALARFDRDR